MGHPGLGGLGGNSTQAIGASFWLRSLGRAIRREAVECVGRGWKEKMPWLGRSQAAMSAQAVVGIRLVGQNLGIESRREGWPTAILLLSPGVDDRDARAWAGQAENPPKPLWAFGWLMSRQSSELHLSHTHNRNALTRTI
jgi:hypothetical protein